MTSSKVRAALELRQKMRENLKLREVMQKDYRAMDLQYEELIGNFNDDEQLEMYHELTKELK